MIVIITIISQLIIGKPLWFIASLTIIPQLLSTLVSPCFSPFVPPLLTGLNKHPPVAPEPLLLPPLGTAGSLPWASVAKEHPRVSLRQLPQKMWDKYMIQYQWYSIWCCNLCCMYIFIYVIMMMIMMIMMIMMMIIIIIVEYDNMMKIWWKYDDNMTLVAHVLCPVVGVAPQTAQRSSDGHESKVFDAPTCWKEARSKCQPHWYFFRTKC